MSDSLRAASEQLVRATGQLAPDQERVARNSARRACLDALKRVRARLDADYPVVPQKKTARRKRNPARAVQHKTQASQQLHRQLLAAGVRPHHFVERGKAGELSHRIYAPTWMVRAWSAGFEPPVIAKAVRSKTLRAKVDTVVRLGVRKR